MKVQKWRTTLSTSIPEVAKLLVDDYKPVTARYLGLGSQVASC